MGVGESITKDIKELKPILSFLLQLPNVLRSDTRKRIIDILSNGSMSIMELSDHFKDKYSSQISRYKNIHSNVKYLISIGLISENKIEDTQGKKVMLTLTGKTINDILNEKRKELKKLL